MDHQDLRTLQILEEIGSNPVPSQRDLAKKLNVSLGLVNSFIKRLAQKGYFKIRTIPKNRVKYILTPKGATEKSRLTYDYIHYSYQFYKGARQKLHRLFESFMEQGIRKVVFYGATEVAEIAFISLQGTELELTAVVDEQHSGETFFKQTVLAPNELLSLQFDKILITALGRWEQNFEKLLKMGIAGGRIATLE